MTSQAKKHQAELEKILDGFGAKYDNANRLIYFDQPIKIKNYRDAQNALCLFAIRNWIIDMDNIFMGMKNFLKTQGIAI